VSKQELALVDLTAMVGCCAPLAREPLTADQAVDLARVFKAMGDPVRLRLLSLIASHEGGEACVCDLSDVFELTGPTISHHLKVLREAGLITGDRRGTWIYYRVQPDALLLASRVLAPGNPPPPVREPRPPASGTTR
jgi:ArsR family transcriptional regulator, arsenate/arsenite/antimonite-responsive transcriptional repressor